MLITDLSAFTGWRRRTLPRFVVRTYKFCSQRKEHADNSNICIFPKKCQQHFVFVLEIYSGEMLASKCIILNFVYICVERDISYSILIRKKIPNEFTAGQTNIVFVLINWKRRQHFELYMNRTTAYVQIGLREIVRILQTLNYPNSF